MPNSYLHDGEQPRCPARHEASTAQRGVPVTYGCGLPAGHAGSHQAERLHDGPLVWGQAPLAGELFKSASNRWASMGTAESAEPECGDPAPNGASVCALPKGHDGGHRNAWSRQLRQLRDNVTRDLRRSEELIEQMDDTERETKQRTDHKISVLSQRLDDTIAKADTIAVQQAERFRQLGKALNVDISGQTWDDLIRRVAQLKSELNREDGYRERAESAELALVQAECDAVDSTQPDCPMKCLRVAGHRGTHLDGAGGAW